MKTDNGANEYGKLVKWSDTRNYVAPITLILGKRRQHTEYAGHSVVSHLYERWMGAQAADIICVNVINEF